MSNPTPKLPGHRRPTRPQSNLSTWIALAGILLGCALLMGLTAMVMPNLLFIVGLVFGAGLFALLHWVTWGRWLMNRRQPPDDDDE